MFTFDLRSVKMACFFLKTSMMTNSRQVSSEDHLNRLEVFQIRIHQYFNIAPFQKCSKLKTLMRNHSGVTESEAAISNCLQLSRTTD